MSLEPIELGLNNYLLHYIDAGLHNVKYQLQKLQVKKILSFKNRPARNVKNLWTDRMWRRIELSAKPLQSLAARLFICLI